MPMPWASSKSQWGEVQDELLDMLVPRQHPHFGGCSRTHRPRIFFEHQGRRDNGKQYRRGNERAIAGEAEKHQG